MYVQTVDTRTLFNLFHVAWVQGYGTPYMCILWPPCTISGCPCLRDLKMSVSVNFNVDVYISEGSLLICVPLHSDSMNVVKNADG